MSQALIMTKGLPGSGKSTWAREQVKKGNYTVQRINKDELREMIDVGKHGKHTEKHIIHYRDAFINIALAAGKTVIVDDTNFAPVHQARLAEIAKEHNVPLIVQSFLDVPVEECIKRDLRRDKSVGKDVIMKMYNQYLNKPAEKVPFNPSLRSCIICDLDGTLALFGDANPYERDFMQDQVNQPVATVLERFTDSPSVPDNMKIILFSGRSAKFEQQTRVWLERNAIEYDQLHMRPENDSRKDSVLKQEMYDTYIKGKYNVLFVLDDRNQVVDMWRQNGLTCLQVAPGDF